MGGVEVDGPGPRAGERRAELLSITRGLVAERGIRALRLQDVATAAGVTAPALYSHFDSREELLAETVRAAAAAVMADIAATDDPVQPAAARLGVRFGRWVQYLLDSDERNLAVLHHAIVEASDDPVIRAAVEAAVDETRTYFTEVLTLGRARGEVRADVDVAATADLVNACFLGIQLGATTGITTAPLPQQFQALLAMILLYVAPTPAPAPAGLLASDLKQD